MSDDAPTVSSATAPRLTVGDLIAAKHELDKIKRIIICHPSQQEAMQAEVIAENLAGVVKVIASLECEPGTAYVARATW